MPMYTTTKFRCVYTAVFGIFKTPREKAEPKVGPAQIRFTNQKTQDEPQWIVTQRLLSALTIPGFK